MCTTANSKLVTIEKASVRNLATSSLINYEVVIIHHVIFKNIFDNSKYCCKYRGMSQMTLMDLQVFIN